MNRHTSLDVAHYLLEEAEGRNQTLTPLQLIKLAYLAHGWMLGLYSRPLITEAAEAWRYGPVYPELYQAVKQFRNQPVHPATISLEETVSDFDEQECNVMEQILDIYGNLTGMQLSTLTHQADTPWHQVWNEHGQQNVPISDKLIEAHYGERYRQADG